MFMLSRLSFTRLLSPPLSVLRIVLCLSAARQAVAFWVRGNAEGTTVYYHRAIYSKLEINSVILTARDNTDKCLFCSPLHFVNAFPFSERESVCTMV